MKQKTVSKLKPSLPLKKQSRGAVDKQSLHITENNDHSFYRILMIAYKNAVHLKFRWQQIHAYKILWAPPGFFLKV